MVTEIVRRQNRGEPTLYYVRMSVDSVTRWLAFTVFPLSAILVAATFMRFWQLTSVGFNSDEAVYAGTAASIVGDPARSAMFPIFRAHPVLFQLILSLAFHGGISDWTARAVPAAIGVATVAITYLLGKRLYGVPAGLIGALLLAVMPYHVVVTRQVLLDGMMAFCATAVIYCVVRYCESGALSWMLATGGMMGLTILAKETSLILLGGLYAFFALTPAVRTRMLHLFLGAIAMIGVIFAFPLATAASGRAKTGQTYLLWQVFRKPNHELLFYFKTVPLVVGIAAIVAATAGFIWLRRENTWRERLLLCWIVIPVVFFTIWPVKGYQYLLPIAPPLMLLAGRAVGRLPTLPALQKYAYVAKLSSTVLALAIALTMAIPAWGQINPSTSGRFLAGTGGVPGGREAGEWLQKNSPRGAQLLTIGPSMANILEFYGNRRAFGLSVSANPRRRNPSYVPVPNPDRSVRDGELQYIVWDSYTANRARFFAGKVQALITKFHGVAVFTATVSVRTPAGKVAKPVVIIYKVRAT